MESKRPVLRTARLELRLGRSEDIPAILRFYQENREHLTPWWPRWAPDFFMEERWQRRISLDAQEFENDISVHFFLFLQEDSKRIIGLCNFNNITRGSAQFCTLGYGLDYREEGKGLMYEAVTAAVHYMFSQRGLHRIQANYIPHNRRSASLLKRLGFVIEGYARDYLNIDGHWEDHILTALIDPFWAALDR